MAKRLYIDTDSGDPHRFQGAATCPTGTWQMGQPGSGRPHRCPTLAPPVGTQAGVRRLAVCMYAIECSKSTSSVCRRSERGNDVISGDDRRCPSTLLATPEFYLCVEPTGESARDAPRLSACRYSARDAGGRHPVQCADRGG